jgi:GNAT superfamily N-acetyltransferase
MRWGKKPYMVPSIHASYKWKPFSLEDLPAILHHQQELYSLNFKNMIFDRLFYSNIEQWYTDGIRHHHCFSNLLFTDKEELIGFYLYQLGEDNVYLMQMFIERSFRGQGYGSFLLQHYEQCGRLQSTTSSFLHASSINAKAVAFYERNGYIVFSEELDEQGLPRYLMFKFIG